MKKLTALAIALTMLLSFAACNSESGGTAEADVTTTTAAEIEAVKDETTTAATEETTEATTTEPVVEATPVEDFDYEETDGEITVTKYNGKDAEVIIPAEIDGKPVTTVGEGAFYSNSSITSVVVPEGVKTIGWGAFYNCGKLADVTLPDSITNIYCGDYYNNEAKSPFTGSPWLENKRAENPLVIVNNILVDGQTCSRDLEIPDGVRVIAGGAFNGCTTITSVKLPNSLETIGNYAFTKCERLTEIILPDSINFIGDEAFNECKVLENVTFPNNTVEMGGTIFGSLRKNSTPTPWLERKAAENPLLIINGNLINGQKCTGNVVVPDDVKSIATDAFWEAEITGAQLPEGMTKIPASLFSNCIKLKSVNIPDSVTEIGSYAFYNTALKSITIPNGVTKIDSYAFFHGSELESITIPGSVTEIGDGAFNDCRYLKSVTLSEGLKKIGSNVFSNTLTELTLPDSVESIAEDAFENCSFDITYKGEVYFPELYNELYAEINGQ